jgi:hypothetical protein
VHVTFFWKFLKIDVHSHFLEIVIVQIEQNKIYLLTVSVNILIGDHLQNNFHVLYMHTTLIGYHESKHNE